MNNFLQIDPSKRLESYKSGEIYEVLELLKFEDYPKIEADWLSFHSLIKVPADFEVDERTLSSRDLYKEITKMNLSAKSGQMATGGAQTSAEKNCWIRKKYLWRRNR